MKNSSLQLGKQQISYLKIVFSNLAVWNTFKFDSYGNNLYQIANGYGLTDWVHVTPVGLWLGMHEGITIYLWGWCKQNPV